MTTVQIGASFDGGGRYAQYLTLAEGQVPVLTGVVDEGRMSEERFTHPLTPVALTAERPEWFSDCDLGLAGDVASWDIDAPTSLARSVGMLAVAVASGYALYAVGEAV